MNPVQVREVSPLEDLVLTPTKILNWELSFGVDSWPVVMEDPDSIIFPLLIDDSSYFRGLFERMMNSDLKSLGSPSAP